MPSFRKKVARQIDVEDMILTIIDQYNAFCNLPEKQGQIMVKDGYGMGADFSMEPLQANFFDMIRSNAGKWREAMDRSREKVAYGFEVLVVDEEEDQKWYDDGVAEATELKERRGRIDEALGVLVTQGKQYEEYLEALQQLEGDEVAFEYQVSPQFFYATLSGLGDFVEGWRIEGVKEIAAGIDSILDDLKDCRSIEFYKGELSNELVARVLAGYGPGDSTYTSAVETTPTPTQLPEELP